MPDDDYEISPPRYLRCKDGRLRKRIIVTFSDKTYNLKYVDIVDNLYVQGPQAPIVHRAVEICKTLGFPFILRPITLEYGNNDVPLFAPHTIKKLIMGHKLRDRGISPETSIKFNINLCQHSHERIS